MSIANVYFHRRKTTRLKHGHVIGCVEADHVFWQQRQGNVGLGITEPSVPGEVIVTTTDSRARITVMELGRRRGLR